MAPRKDHNQIVSLTSLTAEQRKDVKRVVGLINDSMLRASAEKEFQNDEITAIHKKYGVDKKLVRRIAKAQYKQSFTEECSLDEEFKDSYSLLMTSS